MLGRRPRMVDVRRGGGLGTLVGSSSMGRGCSLAWLGRQSCVSRAARLSARSTRLSGGGLTSRRGGGPGCWCDGRGMRVVCLCSLGCGRLGRAASWLDREQWYAGMAVPEGGVGGLRWAWWISWMSGRRPQMFGNVEGIALVSCGRRGCLGALLLEV
jgi:hypothetical protein